MITLETDRLLLRPPRDDDIDVYAEIVADLEVMHFMGGPKDRALAWRELACFLGHWVMRGYGFWMAEEKASGDLVGRVGLWRPDGWPDLEVGWLLARSHWGRGFATEGGRAALDHAFQVLGARHVISLIRPDNAASIRVAERLGEILEGRTELFGEEVLIYGTTRPD